MPHKQGISTYSDLFGKLFSPALSVTLDGKPSFSTTIKKPAEFVNSPSVKRIVYHEPATIVFWNDGTKTVVKCAEGEPFDKFYGFCAALAKKTFGSSSKVRKIIRTKE